MADALALAPRSAYAGLLKPVGAAAGGVTVRDRADLQIATVIARGDRTALAERVRAVVQEGKFPFVLGRDCSILIGNMLALRRRGRFGLVFIDGHLDFRHPGNSKLVGAAAGVLSGRDGPSPALTTVEPHRARPACDLERRPR